MGMDSEKFRKIDGIYERLLELPVREHKAYLNEVCGDDSELREEIESLLKFDDTVDSFIDSSPDFLAAEIFFEKEDMSGERLGNYRILSLLGKGGMGTVYLAEDTSLDRQIAVKFLRREFSSDADKLRRFIQEAKSASALNHPNIITVHEIGSQNGINYIATEFIEGRTLREVIAQERPPALKEILKIAIQISEALVQAHRAGIIHRDIKPENIMLRPDGYVKVLDFGLAKLFETTAPEAKDISAALSTPGLVQGTVAYMSPEQARGLKLDKRTDIWSFGVLLYELLAGKTPFSGETLTDVLVSIIHKPHPALSLTRPEVPPRLSDLIERMLQKDPAERIGDFAAVINELELIRRNLENSRNDLGVPAGAARPFSEDDETIIFDSSSVDQVVSERDIGRNNLSSEINPLIGRLTEVAEISGLLQKPGTRLVTLTGIGGIGKTRLARSIAAALFKKFPAGVYFIDLSTIEDTELVIPFIAKTLGLEAQGEQSLSAVLTNFLRTKKTLLILDNFEQIVRAAPAVGSLISNTENLKILVTSRVRLHLSFENEITIEPLGFPVDESLTADQLSEYPAINLFVERARAIKPNFAFTERNAREITEICRRLDGLPLAIELAAARVKLLAPRAILKRLDKSLKLLTGGAKDLPERQQTMRQTIAWSYDLLEENEKKLLDRVSVFRGGFDIEAAEEIGIFKEDLDILDGLASLVDNSLIIQKEMADGEPRFRLLVVVREFAREKLTGTGELFEAKKRHTEYFLKFAEEAEPEFETGDEIEWLEKTEIEIDNFRAALDWSLENEPEKSLRIAAALSVFWIRRNYLSEGESRIRAALERASKTAGQKTKAKANLSLGALSWRLGDYKKAISHYNESLRVGREIGDQILVAHAFEGLGGIKLMQNDLAAAKGFYEKSYKISRAANNKHEIAANANGLALVYDLQKDYETAERYFEESLRMARDVSYKKMIQISCVNLAGIALRMHGDYESARSYATESIGIAKDAGDKITIGYALEIFAALAVADGKFEKAIRLGEATYTIYKKADYEMEFYEKEYLESYLEKARAKLSGEELQNAEAEGRNLSVEEAVALALGE